MLSTVEHVLVGKSYKQRKVQWLKDEDAACFSLTVLIILLHHYSSRLADEVFLKLSVAKTSPNQKMELHCSPNEDQTFYNLFKSVERDLRLLDRSMLDSLDIEWIIDSNKIALKHRIRLTPVQHRFFYDAVFSSDPHSFYHEVFANASSHYKILAESAHTFSNFPISDLDYLSSKHKHEIELMAYGPKDDFIAFPEFLDHIFENIVEQFPNHIAVADGKKSISYLGLNKKVNRLAHVLMKNGVKSGDTVAILLNRSIEAYAAMLAIMKCGAAYVPLDTDYPSERVNYILNNAGAKFLIAHSQFSNRYADFSGQVLNVDAELVAALSDPFIEISDTVEEVIRSTDDPAYIIYTSGSTGKPKGVVVSHAAASNLVKAERAMFKLKPIDRVAQGFSIAFDASIEEIWLAFSSGAELCPVEKEIMRSGVDLCEFINQQKITVFSTVPTFLSMMSLPLPSLKLLILGGEPCTQELLQRWSNNKLRIVNTYGPTEATVIATASDFDPTKKITIGKPIANNAVFITDASMRPVPVSVAGELCIAGCGLANGYHNNTERTEEKFVTPPFELRYDYPDRIYRTGDLARFNDEGDIEFLGRIDTQVKLRGYRIELSEIESQLVQLPNVKNAVVSLTEDRHKGNSISAYLVLNDQSILFNASSAKYLLRKRLPSYMIPAAFFEIDALPLLASGKVDRKKLVDLKLDSLIENGKVNKESLTKTEEKIRHVWSTYFSGQSISKKDDFFLDLGGHSLLAAKVVSDLRLQAEFKNISVLDIYKNPTIEKLAQQLTLRKSNNGHSPERKAPTKKESAASGIRHFFCGAMQFVSFYFIFSVNLVRDFSSYAIFFYLYHSGYSLERSIAWALVGFVLSYPTLIMLTIAAKWILLGRIKAGRYRLWGGFYLRWWFVRKLFQLLDLYHLAGTPLLPVVYRMLGMNIGKGVHLETDHFAAFDQITIGDGTSIDEEAMLTGFSVQNEFLVIGPITIGKNCFMGTRSVISENAVLEDGARVDDLSLVASGTRIPANETWAGSPAKLSSKINCAELIQPPVYKKSHRTVVSILYSVLICIIPIISAVAFAPGVVLLMQFNPLQELGTYISLLPIIGLSFVLFLTIQVVILKWILVGKVKPGIYPVHGSFYIRNWIVDQLLRISLHHVGQLHATLHVSNWYRALGMKVGSFVELSTAASTTPDLIHLEEGCTIADEVSLGSPHVEKGWMTLAPVHMGYRSFAGNSAVIPAGVTMGDHSLVGVLSITPKREDATRSNATWFGSPAILFPKREPSADFTEEKTYKPSKKLRTMRGAFELMRITFPPAAFIIIAATVINAGILLVENIGVIKTILVLPLIFGASSVLMVLGVALFKWMVMGRYKPFSTPLWSNFVWRLELTNALYEFFAAPLLLELLQGTPFLSWYLKLMGAKIGKQCYIDTTGFLEWDLVNIGDRVVINENAAMQSHLFEDRVLKASQLHVKDDCVIGATSVVLYDSIMNEESKLDALSLLMKGEKLPAQTHWVGIPASSGAIKEL